MSMLMGKATAIAAAMQITAADITAAINKARKVRYEEIYVSFIKYYAQLLQIQIKKGKIIMRFLY